MNGFFYLISNMTSKVVYEGHLRTVCTHVASGSTIITDAPTDNHGRGEAFSPTDTVATALASCMLTVMGIKAQQMELNMDGTTCEVTKIMYAEPRRIGEIHINMVFPANSYSDKEKAILENTARTCPVFYSLHPDLKKEINLQWL